MIFVTVGTQLPFERLVAAVDAWVAAQSPKPEVLAQVGMGRRDYAHIRCVQTLDAAGYAKVVDETRLIVAHAGIGSILAALDRGVPLIVMPRDPLLSEHRDDHQMQTSRQLERMGLVTVAWSDDDLPRLIADALARADDDRPARRRSTELVDFLHGYLQGVLHKGT